jgi:hypothetical protein
MGAGMTQASAEALGKRIEQHWRDRGHLEVKARAEKVALSPNDASERAQAYGVRSNLIRGMPPQP